MVFPVSVKCGGCSIKTTVRETLQNGWARHGGECNADLPAKSETAPGTWTCLGGELARSVGYIRSNEQGTAKKFHQGAKKRESIVCDAVADVDRLNRQKPNQQLGSRPTSSCIACPTCIARCRT